MTHATDGTLLAYVDGEIDGSAAAELGDHLAACAECARELQTLRRLSATTHEALSLVSAPAPMLRAQAAIAAERARLERRSPASYISRLGARGLARAAMLLLALAGAAAAAVPGSPVRRALETTIARVSQLLNGEAVAPAPLPVPAPAPADVPVFSERASMAILPAGGRVRVLLHAPAGPVDVTVRLVSSQRAVVETNTPDADVRLRSAAGRVEVIGLGTGTVTIEVPAAVAGATIEVGGLVYVYKEGRALQLTGPAGNDRGDEVRFRIGS
jgi:hypothetical protein